MYVCQISLYRRAYYLVHIKDLLFLNSKYIHISILKACIKSSDLYRHCTSHNILDAHGHYTCDTCPFTSPTKESVENHMKRHYMIRPDQSMRMQAAGALSRCGICQKTVLRARLFEHKRATHGRYFLKPRLGSRTASTIKSER